MMDDEAWAYVGEGGQHAVFADRGSGRLLRVDKAILRGSSVSGPTASLHSLLHPFVDVPERVFLDQNLVHSLREVARGQVPPRRRRDWTPSHQGACAGGWGCRMPDYRGPSGVSVEIKPKGGYITKSPFVEGQRRHKYDQSRYVLLQELYREGKVVKDWMTEDRTADTVSIPASRYDPIDLFSGGSARIRQALHRLIECPQNNIQIWRGRRRVMGDWSAAVGEALGWPASNAHDANEVMECVIELLVQILLQEPFLSRVLALQTLDILDTDGAILVYRRLLQLCDGHEATAESLLNDFPEEAWMEEGNPIHVPLLKSCPLPQPKESVHLAALCDQLSDMANNLEHGTHPSPRSIELAQQTIESLALDECRYLLQAWLISLTMCDLTFFLHLEQPVTPTMTQTYDDIRVLSLQQPDVPGRISFPPANTELQYIIKAIDVDRKPASKIRSRYAKEVQFDRPD